MPGVYDGYGACVAGLKITAIANRADMQVRLSLAGEVDPAAHGLLAGIADWLRRLAPVRVLIDLSDVAFAGSELPNFLVRASMALPHDTELVVWGAKPSTLRVLQVTHMARIATIIEADSESVR